MTEAIGLTAEMYRAVVTIVDERVKEIRVTREDFNELKGAVQELAQARAEQRVGGLERAMLELAQAQVRTEQRVHELVQTQARAMLPGYLQRHFGIRLEGKLGEELNRHFFHIDGSDVEINLYGEGERDGQRVVVLGEAKSRIYSSDVEKFAHNLAVMDHVLRGEVVRVMFGYIFYPSAEIAARERNILLVASYQR
jgi:hypothetical protein